MVTQTIRIQDVMNKWKGKSEVDILQNFGPPTTATTDGKNGKILNYESKRSVGFTLPGYLGNQWSSKELVSYMQFYVSPDSGMYYWRTNLPDIKKQVKWKDTPEGKAAKEYNRTHFGPRDN